MWEFISQFWDQGVDVATLILAVIGTLSTLGLLRRRSQTLKELIYIEQERDDLRRKLAAAEVRLAHVDPERFIDQVQELYDAGSFDKAEATALDFTNRQSEAFGRAAEVLTEQRILDSETHGMGAIEEALRFVQIGRAADPDSPRLAELQQLAERRAEDIRRGEPLDVLNWEQLSGLELHQLSLALERAGKYALAEIAARRLVPRARVEFGAESTSYANALGRHASALKQLNQFEAAEALNRDALEIARAAVGEDHPEYGTHLSNLAGTIEARGQTAEAERMYRAVLEIDRAHVGESHADYANTLNNLALAVRSQGRLEEAEEMYREVLKIDRRTIGEDHPKHAIHLNNLARVLRAQERFDEAETTLDEVLRIDRASHGEMHPDYAYHLGNLADVLEARGKVAEALRHARRALEILQSTLPEDHPWIAKAADHVTSLQDDGL